jgi:hypothetical protein
VNDARQAPPEVRRSSVRRTPSSPSAGLPGDDPAADERLAELEARLARLEDSAGHRDRGRHVLDRLMPPDASHHFRNAGREELLGIRSIIDFWIGRIDAAEARAASAGPRSESIDVE